MPDYQAELKALKAQERKPKTPKWAREVGDSIVAKVLERGELTGKFGTSERLILEVTAESTESGKPLEMGEERSLACSPARLVDWLAEDDPQVGDTVLILFADRVQSSSGGQPWHDLRAKVLERGDAGSAGGADAPADDGIPF